MFDEEIEKEAFNGIMLHRRDGTVYWKLTLTCSKEGCENEVDMGECLCFDTKEAMEHCRDGHGLHCTVKCWCVDQPREIIEGELAKIEKYNENADEEDIIIGDDEIEMISNWWEYQADSADGCDFYEDFEITECPV